LRCWLGHAWKPRRLIRQLATGVPKIVGTYPTFFDEVCDRMYCTAQRERCVFMEPVDRDVIESPAWP
jgi:hypothetical protein